MKGYTITALLLAATSLLQAQTVDIDLYNKTGYDVKLERNYLPGTPQPGAIIIDKTRDLYNPLRLGNQDLDKLDNYKLYYANSKTPAAIINANELAQRAAQVGAKELIISLEPTGYLTTSGIRVKVTPRGKAQPSQVAQDGDDFVLVGEKPEEGFEPIGK
jgi:hypothetical protein